LISDTTAIFLRAGIFVAAIAAAATASPAGNRGEILLLLLGGGIVWVFLSTVSLLAAVRNPSDRHSHISLICLDVIVVSVIVWAMGPENVMYALLYYIPVLYAASRLEIRSCIASAALAAVAYLFVSLLGSPDKKELLTVSSFAFSALTLATILGMLYAELSARKKLAESLRTSLQRLSAIYDVARTAWSTSHSLEDVLRRVLQETSHLAGSRDCFIALLDKEGRFEVTAQEGSEGDFCWESAQEVAGGERPLHEFVAVRSGEGTRTILTLPLRGTRDLLGAVQIQRRESFRTREVEALQALCAEVAVALENACLRRELVRLATTDPVTELCNRAELSGRLEAEVARALRHGHSLSLLMVDIDGFKAINDRAGHAAGDRVLRRLAEALSQLRKCDSAGRWGGDEFCVLLPETNLEGSLTAAERLREGFRDGREKCACPAGDCGPEHVVCSPTLSIGVISNSDGSLAAEQLLSFADRALYAAKRAGRDKVKAFVVGAESEECPPPVEVEVFSGGLSGKGAANAVEEKLPFPAQAGRAASEPLSA